MDSKKNANASPDHDPPQGDEGDFEDDTSKDLYEILGVEKTATVEEIKASYKKLVEKNHPRRGGDPEKFEEIQEAFQILANPETREVYDKEGMEGLMGGGPGGQGGDDIFNMFFGGGGPGGMMGHGHPMGHGHGHGHGHGGPARKPKGKPVLRELRIKLEDAFTGKIVKLPVERYIPCHGCKGKGGANVQKCKTCKGMGAVQKMVMVGPGMFTQSRAPCTDCEGQGETMKEADKCKSCAGKKVEKQKKELDVKIEPGLPNGKDIIFKNEADELPEIEAGDLVVRVMIENHAHFQRKGADLLREEKITLLQALTGINIEIEHLDGKKLRIASKPGEIISSGQIQQLKGQGMPFYKKPGQRGNLDIVFTVEFPKRNELSNEQREQLLKVLQGPPVPVLDKTTNFEYMDEYHEADTNPNPTGGKNADEPDEEGIPGQQTVQCGQQ